MAKSKFAVGTKVNKRYYPGQKKIIKIKEKVYYSYLIEDKDGGRQWADEEQLSKVRPKKGR